MVKVYRGANGGRNEKNYGNDFFTLGAVLGSKTDRKTTNLEDEC